MQPDEMKTLRKAIGATQAEMADAIGLSRVHYGLMERGQQPIEKRTGMAVRYLAEHPEAMLAER